MKTLTIKNLTLGTGIPAVFVPLQGETAEEARVLAEEAARTPADAVELRLDSLKDLGSPAAVTACLRAVRSAIGPMPLLATLRTSREGGLADVNQEVYESLVTAAISSGEADLVDIEIMRLTPVLKRAAEEAGVPVVTSWHDFEGLSDIAAIREKLLAMRESGASVAKAAVMAGDEARVDEIMALTAQMRRELGIPLVVIAMGASGEISRIAGEKYGSCLTFASAGRASAPGQIPVAEMRKLLRGVHRIRQSEALLYLTGFMGTGKSSVGRELGRMTGQIVCEMDALIEERAGCPIREIFEREGEEGFRKRETECLKALTKEKGAIVSCGGGLIIKEENRRILKRTGLVVRLTAEPETLCERLKGEAAIRPVLQGSSAPERLRALMAEREDLYRLSADITIATDLKSVSRIAREIILAVENDFEVG